MSEIVLLFWRVGAKSVWVGVVSRVMANPEEEHWMVYNYTSTGNNKIKNKLSSTTFRY
jgi:hypothetical protein